MRRLVAILLCSVVGFATQAQTGVAVLDSFLALKIPDTTKADYIGTYAFYLCERNVDTALVLARVAVALAASTKDEDTYASAMNNVGWVYYHATKLDTAEQYMRAAERIYKRQGKMKQLVRVYSNLANVYNARRDYETALTYLLKAEQIVDVKDILSRAMIDRHIGVIYRRKGFKVKSKEYLLKAVAGLRTQDVPNLYADAIHSLGIVYYDEHNYDSALHCYRQGANIYTRLGYNLGASIAFESIGVAFQVLAGSDSRSRYVDSSLFYYKASYDYARRVSSEADMAYMSARLGDIYLLKRDYKAAEVYLRDALADFIRLHNFSTVSQVALSLGELYEAQGNYKKAFQYQVLAGKYKDTVAAQERESAIADMLARYEAEKKDKTIALLNAQNKLLNARKQLAENDLSKRRTTEILGLVITLFAIGLGFVLINRYRIKQRLHELQMRNRISSDLHDDVGSSLSSILLLSNIAKGEDADKPLLLGKISENAAEVIERIGEIVWATNPSYDDGENLRAKIMNYLVPLCQLQGITLHANVSEAVKLVRFSMDSRKNLFLIIKEAANNILKHAQATAITFNAFLKDRALVVEIIDNGIGFDRSTAHLGNGLVTLQSRAAAMKGTMNLETAPGKGSKITVIIPISRSNYFTIKKLDGLYES